MARDPGVQLRKPELLDSLMSSRGYTNRRLAQVVGCSYSMIGLLRSGKQTSCRRCLADLIAKALGVDTGVLFDITTRPPDKRAHDRRAHDRRAQGGRARLYHCGGESLMPARTRRRPLPKVPDPSVDPLLTIREAAEIVGISPSTAYKAAGKGHLPVIPMGRRRLVPTAELLRMLGLDQIPASNGRGAGVPDPSVHPTLTIEQAARILGVSRSHAYMAADRGHLPVRQMAGRRIVPTAELLRILGFTAGSGKRTAA